MSQGISGTDTTDKVVRQDIHFGSSQAKFEKGTDSFVKLGHTFGSSQDYV